MDLTDSRNVRLSQGDHIEVIIKKDSQQIIDFKGIGENENRIMQTFIRTNKYRSDPKSYKTFKDSISNIKSRQQYSLNPEFYLEIENMLNYLNSFEFTS
jgi:hypothetical protein